LYSLQFHSLQLISDGRGNLNNNQFKILLHVDWLIGLKMLTWKVWHLTIYNNKLSNHKAQNSIIYILLEICKKKIESETLLIHNKCRLFLRTCLADGEWLFVDEEKEMNWNLIKFQPAGISMSTTKISLHSNNPLTSTSSSILSVHFYGSPSFTISLTTSSIIKLIFFFFSLPLSLLVCTLLPDFRSVVLFMLNNKS